MQRVKGQGVDQSEMNDARRSTCKSWSRARLSAKKDAKYQYSTLGVKCQAVHQSENHRPLERDKEEHRTQRTKGQTDDRFAFCARQNYR